VKPPTFAKFAKVQTRSRLKSVSVAVRRATKHPQKPEAAHDLRVAIRRFVQCLRMFEGLFTAHSAKKVHKPMHKLMSLAGAKRNYDIGLQVLAEAGLRPQSSVMVKFREKRDDELKTLARYLCRKKIRRDADAWPKQLRAADEPSGEWQWSEEARENAQRVLPPWVEKVFQDGEIAVDAHGDHQVLHQFRLHTKRLRYALEIFLPVYGPELRPKLLALRRLQDRMGAINDCATVLGLPGVDRNTARAVNRLLVRREGALRHYWQETFPPRSRKQWIPVLMRQRRTSQRKTR
jgi:CHAD domain-containing protein